VPKRERWAAGSKKTKQKKELFCCYPQRALSGIEREGYKRASFDTYFLLEPPEAAGTGCSRTGCVQSWRSRRRSSSAGCISAAPVHSCRPLWSETRLWKTRSHHLLFDWKQWKSFGDGEDAPLGFWRQKYRPPADITRGSEKWTTFMRPPD
jgi:hypothetical protein